MKDREILFKYRSLKNFENFLDILLYNRLYGAPFDILNDPMECTFQTIDLSGIDAKKLREERKKLRICALSQNRSNNLMWSHYADGHRGCCIAFEVSPTPLWQRIEITYPSAMPNFPVLKNELETLKSMYSFKSDSWQYEQEIRYVKVVTGNKSPYLPIRVKAVFIGMNASGKQERLIRKIIDMLNRTRKEQIEVKRMTPDNIKIFSTR